MNVYSNLEDFWASHRYDTKTGQSLFPFFFLYFANKQVNMVFSLSSVAVNILCVPINIWEKFIGFCNHFEIRVSARAKARGGVGYQQGRRKYCVWWEQQENIKEISSKFPLHSPGWNFYTLYVSSCNWKGGKWGLSVARAVVQEKKAYLHKLTSVNSFSWFYQGCVWANLVTGFLWIWTSTTVFTTCVNWSHFIMYYFIFYM